MAKYNVSFWNWDEWTAAWPSLSNAKDPFDISMCSEQFQQLWKHDAKVLAVMLEQPGFLEPVSLNQVNDVNERLQAWASSSVYRNTMTFPPTRSAFHDVIAIEVSSLGAELQSKSGTVALILAIVRPWDVAEVLKKMDPQTLTDDWKHLRSQVMVQQITSEQSTDVASVASDTQKDPEPTSVPAPKNPSTFSPPKPLGRNNQKDFTPQIKKHGERFEKWLLDIEKEIGSDPDSLKKQMMNKLIKKDVKDTKGMNDAALNYWFEDVAFPAICTLDVEKIDKLMSWWPNNTEVTFVSPSKTMQNPQFWQCVRLLKQPARAKVLEYVLPGLVETEKWSHKERFDMLANMLERTQNHSWLFEERLKLWSAWGGDLDAEIFVGEEGSMFEVVEKTSARQWLSEKNNTEWNTIIQEKFTPRSSSGAMTP